MNEFLNSYIETALWSSTDNSNDQGGEPLDRNYSADDIAPEALKRMEDDCNSFQIRALNLLASINSEKAQVAHDFWLARNRHGAGFWDGDYSEANRQTLTKWAHEFGECDLYVGDDGKLYIR